MSISGMISKTWDFNRTIEKWRLIPDERRPKGKYLIRNSKEHCLELGCRDIDSGFLNIEWYGQWTQLGVPEGYEITRIRLAKIKTKYIKVHGKATGPAFIINKNIEDPHPYWIQNFTRYINNSDSNWVEEILPEDIFPYTARAEDWVQFRLEFGFQGDATIWIDEIILEIGCRMPGNSNELFLFIKGHNDDYLITELNDKHFTVPIWKSTVPTYINSSMPLSITGTALYADLNLFIAQYTPVDISHNVNLVVINNEVNSSIPIYIIGSMTTIQQLANTVPLYIYGKTIYQSNITLFVLQNTLSFNNQTNPTPLFIAGPTSYNTNLPLYTQGGVFQPINGSIPLFVFTPDGVNESLNLFLAGPLANSITSNFFMIMRGSINQGNWSSIPFFTTGSPMSESLNLVVAGTDQGNLLKLVNLYISGGNPRIGESIPIYILSQPNPVNDIPLFIKGLGKYVGYYPYDESLNLFVQRGPNAGLTLFLANNIFSNNIPLSIWGAPTLNNSLPLIMAVDETLPNTSLPLFIPGDNPYMESGVLNLVIPKIIETEQSFTLLYINGFEY